MDIDSHLAIDTSAGYRFALLYAFIHAHLNIKLKNLLQKDIRIIIIMYFIMADAENFSLSLQMIDHFHF